MIINRKRIYLDSCDQIHNSCQQSSDDKWIYHLQIQRKRKDSRISKFIRFSIIFYWRQKFMWYVLHDIFIKFYSLSTNWTLISTAEIYIYCPAASLEEDTWLLAFFCRPHFSKLGPKEESMRAIKNTSRNSTIRSHACVPFRWMSELISSQFRTCSCLRDTELACRELLHSRRKFTRRAKWALLQLGIAITMPNYVSFKN